MTKVLVVQTAYLGDVVLTTPLLRALRGAGSGLRIEVVTTPGGAALLEATTGIDGIHVYDKRASGFGLGGLRALARRLRALRFDAGIAAQRSLRTAILLRLAGIPRIVGFSSAAGAWGYHETVSWRAERDAARRYLALSAPLGGRPDEDDGIPRLGIAEDAVREVDRLLASNGLGVREPFVCIAPGSARATKRWPPDRFGAVARGLAAGGMRSVIVGAPHETAACAEASGGEDARSVDLAGRLDLRLLPAIAARAAAMVGNDSAPTHVAAAVGTPVTVVFGPTVPAMGYVPRGGAVQVVEHPSLACRPCSRHGGPRCPLRHFRCMREIDPGTVLEAVRRQAVRPG